MITYENYFVVFLDVLGFTKMVKDKDHDKLSFYIDNVNKVISEVFVGMNAYNSLIISDSVIISVPTSDTHSDNFEIFFKLISAISDLQRKFALKNIWLRGGISVGEAYISPDKKNIFGNAYLSALTIEKEFAKFPRVVIDPIIINFLEVDTSQEIIHFCNAIISEPNWASRNSLFFDWQSRRRSGHVIDQDVDLFIDYLYPIIKNQKEFHDLLLIIKENLKLSLEFYPKYRWVVNYLFSCYNRYHSEICSETYAEYQLLLRLS